MHDIFCISLLLLRLDIWWNTLLTILVSMWIFSSCCCSVASRVWLFATHGLQHSRVPCPSLFPGVCLNSCPSSQWCHPNTSSSVFPFCSCLQCFPVSGSFVMSYLFAWGGQSVGSFSFSMSPSNEYSGLISFRMDWFDLSSVQGTFKSLLKHHSAIIWCSAFLMVQLSHPYMTNDKIVALTIWTFVGKVMSLLFNTLSGLS